MNPLMLVLLLAIGLLLIVAPFAAFAPLMLIAFFTVLAWMSWTIIRTLLTGETGES